MGIEDHDRIYTETELARGDMIVFAATGVTDGDLLRGVRFHANGAETNSLVMRLQTGTIRTLATRHRFDPSVPLEGR
jgi:fructose-1,6-bisphosphatase/sedoheptulose 1,7-bisphosphatase-like protein